MRGLRLLALLFVLALVAAACGDSADTTTTTAAPVATTQAPTTTTVVVAPTGPETVSFEGLIGTWLGDWRQLGANRLQLNEDGTYRIFNTFPGAVDVTGEQGQFTLEGTLFTFISNEDSLSCEAGQRGSYETEVLDPGPADEDQLKLVQVEDECSPRGRAGDVTLVRVSAGPESSDPASTIEAYVTATTQATLMQ